MLVYKYRGGNDEIFNRDLDSLEQNYYWSASLESLNDTQENMISSDIFIKQSNFISRFFGKKSNQALLSVHEALETFLSHNKRVGIYSLSRSFNDELLWSHYANSHSGFCVEYELEKLLTNHVLEKRYSFPVVYNNSPSELNFRDIALASNNDNLIQKAFGYKSKKWEYEKEYRIVNDDFGRHSYDFKAVKAIYFGLRMPVFQKEEVIKRLKGRGIKYYQIIQVEKKYELSAVLINDTSDTELKYLKHIPFEITNEEVICYEIFENYYIKLSKKAEIKVALKKNISQDQIKWLSNFFKEHLFQGAETIFMYYYLENI
ncbi:hypothetical protein D3C85_449850 [compost metagenome]